MDQLNRIISLFNKLRYDSVINTNKTFKECQNDLENGKRFSIYSLKTIDNIIGRNGDIVVGFYSNKEIKFKITHNDYSEIIYLNDNQFKYALNNSYPLLLLCVDYEYTKIDIISGDINDLQVIYGILPYEDRQYLCTISNYISFDDNYLYHSKRINKIDYNNLPYILMILNKEVIYPLKKLNI